MSKQLFETAARNKFRFESTRGLLMVEDLWDLPLPELNTLAKFLNKKVKDESEESFIEIKSSLKVELESKLELVKHVIGVKLQEAEAKKVEKTLKLQRARIAALINEKEDEALSSKSLEELKAMLGE